MSVYLDPALDNQTKKNEKNNRLVFDNRCPATVECSAHSDEAAWDYTRHIQKEPQDPSF